MIFKIRTCRKCGTTSQDARFLVRKNGRRENICLPCHRECYALWYEKNRAYNNYRVEEWKRANPDKAKASDRRKWIKKKQKMRKVEEYAHMY